MTDVHNKEVRSYNMSKIKAKNTRPEILLRKHLFSLGFRFRIHDTRLPGNPDLILKKYNTVIFVHGCFWHGHNNCKYFVIPKTRKEWWTEKIGNTKRRDIASKTELIKLGWKVIEIWECELKPGRVNATLDELVIQLYKNIAK